MKSVNSNAKKYIVIILFLIAALFSVIFMSKVAINYDISDYLDDSTETKISLDIINDEFGMTGDIQVMVEDISADTAKNIKDTLKEIPYVLNVNFDAYDETYYKDNNALFIVIADGDEYSDGAIQVASDIKAELDKVFGGKTYYAGAVINKQEIRNAITNEIVYIVIVAVCLAAVIMLLTSKSWLEPIILLTVSGVAILINMGTNIIFGEISYITNSVAAILQLALSIDYSIVLLHNYRTVKETEPDSIKAMARAVKEVIKPVSASSLTTIAGLLALLFMTFKIGFDIGIVLMKGIVISAVTSLTLLPAVLLVFEKPMAKTQKRELVLKGKVFCKFAFKAGKVIVPLALVVIIVCGILHTGNSYTFTDTKLNSTEISNTFGQNNSVVVVYPNGEDNFGSEQALIEELSEYKKADGTPVLKNYTAYTNTIREYYDIDKAAKKLDISEDDVVLLFTMYHLYGDSSIVKLTPMDFVKYADYLIENDSDTADFTGEDTTKTIRTMLTIDEIMDKAHTAEDFHTLATIGVMEGTDLELFSVKQMYGLYYYDKIADKTVDFETMLNYMIAASKKSEVSDMFDIRTATSLIMLSQGIKQFNTSFESNAVMQSNPQYATLYAAIHSSYTYDKFIPALSQIATALTGQSPNVTTADYAIQQIYIMYFYEKNTIPVAPILGKTFVDFVKDTYPSNPVVAEKLSENGKAKLNDMCDTYDFLHNETVYDFREMTVRLKELQSKIKSTTLSAALGSDKVSGVYIKYAHNNGIKLDDPMMANQLLDFVTENMDSNELLKKKMTDANRKKVADAQMDIEKAENLFVGETYSRMLLSVDLPSESGETSDFVKYLSSATKEVFGENAHIAGEIVSTNDLKETFNKDNLIISIFTLVSIFIIVMLVFRSLSLPILLVAVIQGAIWISMSVSLITGPMFFMSYIVATCILMGATIDYGILMSTNYIQYRATLDKKEALYKSVEAAMPTVFTSGMILTVCGFVIGIIASQNSISTVGLLLGKGTLVSVLMITLVLPSVLYLLDKFIVKLSLKKK